VLIFAVICITLPFLGKAFHLDDTILVRLAQEQLRSPLSLGLPDYGFGGDFFARYYDTHPPLIAGYLALLIKIFGGAKEAGLHAGFIIFPLLAAASMFFLARRFSDSPLTAALLLVLSPGFMVMAASIMTDVPSLAFWLAAIAAYVQAVDRDDNRLLMLAGAFTALAMLTTYQSFSLFPLLLLYAFLQRRLNLRNLLPLGVALVAFAGVFLAYYVVTGGPPKLSYSIGLNFTPAFIANKILSSVSVLGGAIVFPAILAVGLVKGKKEYFYLAALLAAMVVFFLTKVPSGQYTAVSAILQAIFYSAGILIIYRFINAGIDAIASKQWQGKALAGGDTIFLVLWICGVLTYCILLLPYASTRYLLPLFPPVVLMFVRYAGGVIPAGRRWQLFAVAAIVCTGAAGLAASVSDYRLSGVYRAFASDQAPKLQADGHRLWFAGEFGLRYYLEENGGTYLTRMDNSPVAGDRVALSHEIIAYYLSDELRQRLIFERSIVYPTAWPVRLEDFESRAGFYAQFHGNLPYSLSSGPIETIDIYTVR